MPELRLDVVDAAELAELLQFLAGWLARDPGRLGASPEEFAGHPACNVSQLRQDLGRFTFLLGGDDGESLSGPDRQGEAPVTVTSPLRGPKSPEGGGFAAADPSGAPRRVRGRPSGPQGAPHRAGARQPCGLPLTPETAAAPGTRKNGQAQACPRAARGAQTRQWRATGASRTSGHR
jgi:hypothetical protein